MPVETDETRNRVVQDSPRGLAGPWAIVALLVLIGVLNLLDRLLPSILAQQIKEDLHLSDTALGLINGVIFLSVYSIAALPLARLSDGGRHRAVISLSLAVWSLMTLVGGWVTTGWQLAATRMGVALGEAAGIPAAHAYITRSFPPDRRATALSIYMMSLPLGTTLGFAVGGLMGEFLGWRRSFLLMGVLGLLLAVFTFGLLRRTDPTPAVVQAQPGPHGFLLLLRKRSVIAILAAVCFVTFGGYAATAFTPAFLMRGHDLSVAEAGVKYGVLGGVGSIAALLVVGWLADRLSRRDPRWLLGVIVAMIGLGLPFSVASFTLGDADHAVLLLAVNQIITIAYTAPTFAALHRLTPVMFRARASALVLVCSGVIGGLGPLAIGLISDALEPRYGEAALGRALLLVPVAYALAAFCYGLAMISYRQDLADEPASAVPQAAAI